MDGFWLGGRLWKVFQAVAGSEGCCRFPAVDWQRFEKSKHATRTSAILQRYLIQID
jgi:hypothetical protein